MTVTASLVLMLLVTPAAAAVILGLDDVNTTDVTHVKFDASHGSASRGQYIGLLVCRSVRRNTPKYDTEYLLLEFERI